MLENSPRLAMPLMQQGQAQKHVTHNEALELLDVLVQLTVESFAAEAPPAAPEEGQVWAVGPAPTGKWAGEAKGTLAAWANGGWLFIRPKAGWRAASGNAVRVWTGADWQSPSPPEMDDLPGLGVGAAHDADNRLAVASPGSLFSHVGDNHRLKINKAVPGDSASLLFQTGFSGRAELGTAGSDDFTLKVSPDGADWQTVLSVDTATGRAALKDGATIGGAEAYHRGNILGSVGATAGMPTGAVIERGNNANGHYVRFADGTQFCWNVINSFASTEVPSGAIWVSPEGNWTFPASFAAAPTTTGNCRSSAVRWVNARPVSASSANIRVLSPVSSASPVIVDVLAVGRWF